MRGPVRPRPAESFYCDQCAAHDIATTMRLLQDLEQWSAEVLESHLSFPVLSFYRSQHDNQSWLAAVTTALMLVARFRCRCAQAAIHQAELTFAMSRHVVVDLSLVFQVPPEPVTVDRLPADSVAQLRAALADEGIHLIEEAASEKKLAELRAMYEPFLVALGAVSCSPCRPCSA